MAEKEIPGYYSVIPAEVRYDNQLCANEKLMYGEITALCNKTGECWATNNYFAELYDVVPQRVSKWINNLKKAGYITVEMIYVEGTKQIEKRVISINNSVLSKRLIPINKNVNTPINKKVKDNTTSKNTILSKDNSSNELSSNEEDENFNDEATFSKYEKSRNFRILSQYVSDCFNSEGIKESLYDFLDMVYNSRKATITLKQFRNLLDFLKSNVSTEQEFIDAVNETTEKQYLTFRYVIENSKRSPGAKAPTAYAVKEQKTTTEISKEIF